MNAEQKRLVEANSGSQPWRKWGAYLSDRQWGTVREDYSANGDAWNYISHDQARSRAYRWGEDGLAGISDDRQLLCLGLVLWNTRDPILKERLFGLTNEEGNHGEDVKELYYQLDATPTHSYLKLLYKYPQAEFPYQRLIDENRRRDRTQPEFELFDTGIFHDDRYFDLVIEYAKAGPEDILMQVTACNRGPEAAPLVILPHIWFRNVWSWNGATKRPELALADDGTVTASHPWLGSYRIVAQSGGQWLFTENETNFKRLFGVDTASPHAKDSFHEFVIRGDVGAVNPSHRGTKSAALYRFTILAGGKATVRLRISAQNGAAQPADPLIADFDKVFHERRAEADAFYHELQEKIPSEDARLVQRQALAGMIWNQQYFHYNVAAWLDGDKNQPPPPRARRRGRNADWRHLNCAEILSMPDKWEYPWFAAWDTAFHTIALALVDPEFAKNQLVVMTREWYQHPNGALPAYEWTFGDANPPVHAWAAWRIFQMDCARRGGQGDTAFLERVFHKLLLNFTWWVNRKDAENHNVFQGGFLGLDNIGVFDRNVPLPDGGQLAQADGTAWMAMYSLNMLRIALELALNDPVYQDIATKFFEHFLSIAAAMTSLGEDDGCGVSLWDNQDEFFYDVVHFPDGRTIPIRIHSMVGLTPLFAVETLEPEMLDKLPEFAARLGWYLKNRPDLADLVSRWQEPGRGERRLLSLLRGHRMKRLLYRMLDETRFLSDYGVRSLSQKHRDEPFRIHYHGHCLSVKYEPGESECGIFGGNSNWRGPVWFPVNYLIIESLQKFHHYYGDDFKIECPTGSGQYTTILGVAEELTRRLSRLFLRDEQGRRTFFGSNEKFQTDPHFRDCLQFHEYFHGDNGQGLGASHQTGWTGLIAKLLAPKRAAE